MDLHSDVDFTLFMFRLIGTVFRGLDGEGIYGVRWLANSLTNLGGRHGFWAEALRILSKVEISRTSRPMAESRSKGGLLP